MSVINKISTIKGTNTCKLLQVTHYYQALKLMKKVKQIYSDAVLPLSPSYYYTTH